MRVLVAILLIGIGVLGFLYYQEVQNDVSIELEAPEIE